MCVCLCRLHLRIIVICFLTAIVFDTLKDNKTPHAVKGLDNKLQEFMHKIVDWEC